MVSEAFRGEFYQKVDSKARVSIPAAFRRILEAEDPASGDSRPLAVSVEEEGARQAGRAVGHVWKMGISLRQACAKPGRLILRMVLGCPDSWLAAVSVTKVASGGNFRPADATCSPLCNLRDRLAWHSNEKHNTHKSVQNCKSATTIRTVRQRSVPRTLLHASDLKRWPSGGSHGSTTHAARNTG